MAIGGIGSSLSGFVQKTASGGASQPSAVAAAQQEATETQATTAKEARSGDQVAIRKLAAEKAKEAASEPGKGTKVDEHA